MEMYEVYDKNAGPDDLAIETFFTEQAARAKVAQLATEGRGAAYTTFTPQCTWGSAYASTRCQAEAVWFKADWGTYGAVCGEHYHPDWMPQMIDRDEAVRREQGKGQVPAAKADSATQAGFWFQER